MANRLIHEQSLYLLQHAHNPVDWYPWCDEAFEKAKTEHKPVIISIGYAACHWCHVMERESFENEEVAAFMNAHFVCIKVDREEHPDVDHFYMDAVQAISGSGGWPLNVFATPGRIPFYGGTYYPPRPAFNRPSWMQLLARMWEIWHTQPQEVDAQAEQMINYLRQAAGAGFSTAPTELDAGMCNKIAQALLKQADTVSGGFGGAPKFPGTMAVSFLLEHYHFFGDRRSLEHALLTLDRMTEGGIYDQLGGGLARYSTDDTWLVPHFEKMLYDNALLLLCLCDAYAITKKPSYKKVIEETVAFAERELRMPSGGYYSALDADSEGAEGKFYTWTWEEWMRVTGDEAVAACLGVVPGGNWEGTNILHVARSVSVVAETSGITEEDLHRRVEQAKGKLRAARAERIRPALDDKSLLSWNALMNMALSRCAVVLGNAGYLAAAEEHLEWMLERFRTERGWMHVWKNGEARVTANLDDHAFLIQALLQFASAGGKNGYINEANEMMEYVLRFFSAPDHDFFYFTSSLRGDIPVRKIDLYDGATPSANAVLAHSLYLLGYCMEKPEWQERAVKMLKSVSGTIMRYPYSFGYWSVLLQRITKELKLVVCSGVNASNLSHELQSRFLPQAYILTSEKQISEVPVLRLKNLKGESLIFVCNPQACLPPLHYVNDALPVIDH